MWCSDLAIDDALWGWKIGENGKERSNTDWYRTRSYFLVSKLRCKVSSKLIVNCDHRRGDRQTDKDWSCAMLYGTDKNASVMLIDVCWMVLSVSGWWWCLPLHQLVSSLHWHSKAEITRPILLFSLHLWVFIIIIIIIISLFRKHITTKKHNIWTIKTCAPRVRKATTALTTDHKGRGYNEKNWYRDQKLNNDITLKNLEKIRIIDIINSSLERS